MMVTDNINAQGLGETTMMIDSTMLIQEEIDEEDWNRVHRREETPSSISSPISFSVSVLCPPSLCFPLCKGTGREEECFFLVSPFIRNSLRYSSLCSGVLQISLVDRGVRVSHGDKCDDR